MNAPFLSPVAAYNCIILQLCFIPLIVVIFPRLYLRFWHPESGASIFFFLMKKKRRLSPSLCMSRVRPLKSTKKELLGREQKLNDLTSFIHYSLCVSSNNLLFLLSSCWLFIIHNRFRVQRIALVKFRLNYNTFGNNITQLISIRCYFKIYSHLFFC